MIYVSIEAIKSEGRGRATGNGWQDTDDIAEAVTAELASFARVWEELGHGPAVTYTITVAPESSPRRTIGPNNWPLPVRTEA